MKSTIVKRSVVVAGHKTSISLEDEFWNALKEIARSRDSTRSALIASIEAGRQQGNLSSAIRLHVLRAYRDELTRITSLGTEPGRHASPDPLPSISR